MIGTYQLKDAFQRVGALLGVAVLTAGLFAAAVPASVFADALNPLTERSLTLSSSSPGWSFLDGSGNTTYAPPNSGANGQKTGNTFQFRVSTPAPNNVVKGMTFQYCTSPAGECIAPGDNATHSGTGTLTLDDSSTTVTGSGTDFEDELVPGSVIITAGGNVYTVATVEGEDELTLTANPDEDETGVAFTYREVDTDHTSDLNIVYDSMDLIDSATWTSIMNSADKTPDRNGSEGEFVVLTRDTAGTGTGTIDLSSSSDEVTGTGTSFLTELVVGSTITTEGGNTYTVTDIDSDTSLTLDQTAAENEDDATFTFVTEAPANKYTSANDWAVSASNVETGTATDRTGKNNFITMTSSTGISFDFQDYVKVIFFATDDNYITNPGSGAFFVRMNTYSTDNPANFNDSTLIDGGVTVANVMNESITITTKVLETMEFSVGTHDPTTFLNSQLTAVGVGEDPHGQCNTLLMADPTSGSYSTDPHNVLRLGDPSFEYSLSTTKAYAVESYWRLSSNSSGGATVYYTGHTLTNTVGDEIAPLDELADGRASQTGTEQFGLAIAHDSDTTVTGLGGAESYPVWEPGDDPQNPLALYAAYGTYDADGGGGDGDFASFLFDNQAKGDVFAHYPRLYPLVPMDPYDGGAGDINDTDAYGFDAKFAFNANADTFAIPIATESDQVVNCVTAKMRYLANIAATTPAGIYTTKINYVASPQY